jgi:hypothetical protein
MQIHTDKPTSKSEKLTAAKLRPLDEAVLTAMKNCERDLQHELGYFRCPEQADFQDRVTINGYEFSTYRSCQSHGVIFFQDAGDASALVPGTIRAIFLVTQDGTTHTFLAVHRHLALPTSLSNPFARYPDFGANLWSADIQEEVTIVPGSRRIYHAIYREWEYKIMVMKPLNRVSNTTIKWRSAH